jgi:hypothetical protein
MTGTPNQAMPFRQAQGPEHFVEGQPARLRRVASISRFIHENTSIAIHTRFRQRWLILFSLDAHE